MSDPASDRERDAIITAVKQIESDALYTSQTNFTQAAHFRRLHFWVGIPAVIAAALASASIIASWSTAIAGIAGLVAAILTAIQTFVNPERQAVEHNLQGAEYRDLQKSCHRFRTVGILSAPRQDQRSRLDDLARRQTDLNRLNRPSEAAFRKAQAKVARGDPLHPGDEELT